MSEQITIYPAAALFNGRETSFNLELIDRLEEAGYETKFPQRDGFEFGRLTNALSGKIPQNEVSNAVQQVIYFLDMGIFIPQSEVIVANLDEPQDEGVMVEISYAKLMDKFVIGYRTDVRSPYGNATDDLGGIHFFPAFQCDYFIKSYQPCRTQAEKTEGLDKLAKKVDDIIRNQRIKKNGLPKYALENPHVQKILSGAEVLFEGIEDIHSGDGLEEIAKRYVENQGALKTIYPLIEIS